jgi:hypothetical protein
MYFIVPVRLVTVIDGSQEAFGRGTDIVRGEIAPDCAFIQDRASGLCKAGRLLLAQPVALVL